MPASAALPRPARNLMDALTAANAPLLFALRLWASVCLALFIAFWLELDNPAWAGTTAAIMCQPQLGASLRKGWFRMIGTVIGATMIVVLTALFPQDRIIYLGLLAVWCGACAFMAVVLRNFASYAAALAGYTAAIIAADTLGATGGANTDVFLLAVWRASEICLGIVCAGLVLAGTDLGGAQQKLATSMAGLAADVARGWIRMLGLTTRDLAAQPPDTTDQRRELVRRAIALEPTIEQTLGESSHIRYRASALQTAIDGLFRALDAWRGVASHLIRSPGDLNRQWTEALLTGMPLELRRAMEADSSGRWIADPVLLRSLCEDEARRLAALPAPTPSLRLLTDETLKLYASLSDALNGIALLVDAPGYRPQPGHRGVRLAVPDWLPALIAGLRGFVAIAAVEMFWVATAWPSGATMIVFTAIGVLLFSPRGDLAYTAGIALALGAAGSVFAAAVVKFAILPAFSTFAAFCLAIGLVLVPVGFGIARAQRPAVSGILTGMIVVFLPVLAPSNPISYDIQQFYNSVVAIAAGCALVPLAFRLVPPLSPILRTRRLLALTLHDLRRLVSSPKLPSTDDWKRRVYGRLAALPEQAEPRQRAELLAALSVGSEIIGIRRAGRRLGKGGLHAALEAFANGRISLALRQLRELDHDLASDRVSGPEETVLLRLRARLLIMSEALSRHASYFDGRTAA